MQKTQHTRAFVINAIVHDQASRFRSCLRVPPNPAGKADCKGQLKGRANYCCDSASRKISDFIIKGKLAVTGRLGKKPLAK